MRDALELRRSLSIPREDPVNVFEIATQLGVEIRFLAAPSLEGMYSQAPRPVIVLPTQTHRPAGRIAFSCAHELGHCRLRHGTRVDQYVGQAPPSARSPEELAADVFASSLLMPRQAVVRRFECRGWAIASADSIQMYVAAGELGVGYATLVKHCHFGLEALTTSQFDRLRKSDPKDVRQAIRGNSCPERLVVVDALWAPSGSIDLEVGDLIAVPSGQRIGQLPPTLADGDATSMYRFLVAARAGVGEITIDGTARRIRTARSGYVGSYRNRFLPEAEHS